MKEIFIPSAPCYIQISDEDYDYLNKFTWHLTPKNYVRTFIYMNNTRINIGMHQIIYKRMNFNPNKLPEHKDNNPKNNQRNNIREATYCQNQYNRKKNKKNKSGYKNIYPTNRKDPWLVQLMINKIKLFIGRYRTLEEAIKARDLALIKYHGEFANFG